MSESTPDPTPDSTPEPTTPPDRRSERAAQASSPSTHTTTARWWLIPAATFLVGLLLGGVIIGVLRPATTDASAGPTPSASQSGSTPAVTGASGPSTATVVVPAECLQVAQDSQSLVALTQQAAGAARDLDAARLSKVVRQIDEAQKTLRTHADACRAVDASLTSGSTPSETTVPSTPSPAVSSAPTADASTPTASISTATG